MMTRHWWTSVVGCNGARTSVRCSFRPPPPWCFLFASFTARAFPLLVPLPTFPRPPARRVTPNAAMMQSSGSNTQRKDDYQLVSRLVQYAFRVFNLDMNGFFMKYCDVFDQTPAEMKKNGETLEQYEAFRKCVREAVRLRGRADARLSQVVCWVVLCACWASRMQRVGSLSSPCTTNYPNIDSFRSSFSRAPHDDARPRTHVCIHAGTRSSWTSTWTAS
jgi:hypothetical protein